MVIYITYFRHDNEFLSFLEHEIYFISSINNKIESKQALFNIEKRLDIRELAIKRKLRNRRYLPQKITTTDYKMLLQQYEIEHQNQLDEPTKEFNKFLLTPSNQIIRKTLDIDRYLFLIHISSLFY